MGLFLFAGIIGIFAGPIRLLGYLLIGFQPLKTKESIIASLFRLVTDFSVMIGLPMVYTIILKGDKNQEQMFVGSSVSFWFYWVLLVLIGYYLSSWPRELFGMVSELALQVIVAAGIMINLALWMEISSGTPFSSDGWIPLLGCGPIISLLILALLKRHTIFQLALPNTAIDLSYRQHNDIIDSPLTETERPDFLEGASALDLGIANFLSRHIVFKIFVLCAAATFILFITGLLATLFGLNVFPLAF